MLEGVRAWWQEGGCWHEVVSEQKVQTLMRMWGKQDSASSRVFQWEGELLPPAPS